MFFFFLSYNLGFFRYCFVLSLALIELHFYQFMISFRVFFCYFFRLEFFFHFFFRFSFSFNFSLSIFFHFSFSFDFFSFKFFRFDFYFYAQTKFKILFQFCSLWNFSLSIFSLIVFFFLIFAFFVYSLHLISMCYSFNSIFHTISPHTTFLSKFSELISNLFCLIHFRCHRLCYCATGHSFFISSVLFVSSKRLLCTGIWIFIQIIVPLLWYHQESKHL